MSRIFTGNRRKLAIVGGLATSILVVAVVLSVLPGAGTTRTARADTSYYFSHFGEGHPGDEAPRGANAGDPLQELYADQAYPATSVGINQTVGASNAWQALSKHSGVPHSQNWTLVGPSTGNVPGPWTYTGNASVTSGRVTAIAVSNTCSSTTVCRVWVAAAGGGIWATNNGLAQQPNWHYSSTGLPTNSIGSIVVDPTDPSGRTLYVGTGEPNGSSDSEAGMGLYKSTDYGDSWTLVSGSFAVAANRSIAAVAIDPTNPSHIYIGTAVGRHGLSSVAGGRYTPPNPPQIGLYESTDGGATFSLVFSQPSDTVDPTSPNGSDFFRGGVTGVSLDPADSATVYVSLFDYGVYRRSQRLDGDTSFRQVFVSAGGGTYANSSNSRTEFALAPNGANMRIYVGDNGSGPASLYRVDNANVPASSLVSGGANTAAWIDLSSSTKGTPGYGSYNFCEGQCWYDMFVESPAGHPDTVWIGGSMAYGELFGPSNGRAVQRSTDAGVNFTDMTNDAAGNGMHPDQHALAFDPADPDVAFVGSDGGVVRTSGSFANSSSTCSSRGLTGANLADCQAWLSAIPTRNYDLNTGLSTLQFQSVTVNLQNPSNDVIGGTQDNGTWAYTGPANKWFETVGGDGGQSIIDVGNPNIRVHTYFGPQPDVNFQGTNPVTWDWIGDPLVNSGEAASFYIPMVGDPVTSQSMYAGLQHVWRTTDSGGAQSYLDATCNEFTGTFTSQCGDWAPLGSHTLTGSFYGTDKGGSYVVAIARATDTSTMWVGTRIGRLFITTNANAADPSSVSFTRIDSSSTPTRFISGIQVDPANPDHAFVSFSGYDAYATAAGTATGHVFDVTYNPGTGTATWKDISYDMGDVPVTDIAFDKVTGDLYASSDFGVAVLRSGTTTWVPAAPGLPNVTVYGITLAPSARLLYAATHGHSIWVVKLG